MPTIAPATPDICETSVEATFDQDYIAELADRFPYEGDDRASAVLSSHGKDNHLTVLQKDEIEDNTSLQVYIFPDSLELYAQMDVALDKLFRESLRKPSRFAASWDAMLTVLEDYQIVSTTVDM